jgi:hypothetical protein
MIKDIVVVETIKDGELYFQGEIRFSRASVPCSAQHFSPLPW